MSVIHLISCSHINFIVKSHNGDGCGTIKSGAEDNDANTTVNHAILI